MIVSQLIGELENPYKFEKRTQFVFSHLHLWKKIGYDSLRLTALYDIIKDYNLNLEDIKILQRMVEFKNDDIQLDFSDGTPEIEDLNLEDASEES